jgi:hypothetical protein
VDGLMGTSTNSGTRHTSCVSAGIACAVLTLGGIGLTWIGLTSPGVVRAACPVGRVANQQVFGSPCQPNCPPGTIIDGVTGSCAGAPGVPPQAPLAVPPAPQAPLAVPPAPQAPLAVPPPFAVPPAPQAPPF